MLQRWEFYTQHLAEENCRSMSWWNWDTGAGVLSLHSPGMGVGSQNEAEGPLNTSRAVTNV